MCVSRTVALDAANPQEKAKAGSALTKSADPASARDADGRY